MQVDVSWAKPLWKLRALKTGVKTELKAHLFYYPMAVAMTGSFEHFHSPFRVRSSYWAVASWKWPRTAFPNSSYISVETYDQLSLLESGAHNLLAEVVKKQVLFPSSLSSLISGWIYKNKKQKNIQNKKPCMFLRMVLVEAQDRTWSLNHHFKESYQLTRNTVID